MRKNTGTRTATTFTLPAAMYDGWDAETKAELMKPSVWPTEEGARQAVERLSRWHLHTVNFAPGLEVHAFYAVCPLTGQRHLVTVIVFEDDTVSRLHTAVRKARPVTVTYVTAEGEETVRTIEPRSVQTTKGGDVIVKALDRKSGLHRSFRADRIRAYTIHRTAFLVGEPVRVEDPETGKAQTVSAADYAALTSQALAPAPLPAPLPAFYTTDPETAARWDDETLLGHLAEAWTLGHTLARI